MTDDRLDPAALGRLHDDMAASAAAGHLPGLVTLVARGDEVHVDAIGTPSFADPTPLARDAIFRIASLTKPIVAAAALTLVEDGRLSLDQPIDELVPEMADRRVLRSIDAELDDTVPAARPITVEDLLTSRMGFGSVMAPPDTYPIQRAEAAAQLQSIGGPPWPPVPHDVDSWIAALGTLPLMDQPGERWLYGTSLSVLGIVVARAGDPGGGDLGSVLRTRLFEPLGMHDTGFFVPAGKLDRLTTFYVPADDTPEAELSVLDEPPGSWWSTPPRWPDGAGWLVSTIDDFWAFVTMLLAGGSGVLTPAMVDRMTSDRMTPAQRDGNALFFSEHGSWGYGLATPAAGAGDHPLPHGFGWDGGTGVTWRSNPDRGVTGILFTQRQAMSPAPTPLELDFWSGVNAATPDAATPDVTAPDATGDVR